MRYIFLLFILPLHAISMHQPKHILKAKYKLSNGDIRITFSSDYEQASAIKTEQFFDNFEGEELKGKFVIFVADPRDLFLSLKYQYKEQKKRAVHKNKLQ